MVSEDRIRRLSFRLSPNARAGRTATLTRGGHEEKVKLFRFFADYRLCRLYVLLCAPWMPSAPLGLCHRPVPSQLPLAMPMKRIALPAVLVLLACAEFVAPVHAAAPKSLSIKDLGLGMPKEPEAVFDPRWSIEAGVLAMGRSSSPSVALANGGGTGTSLNASDPGFELEWGPYVSVSTYVFKRIRAEIVYFGIYDWAAGASLEDPGAITTGVFNAGATVFDRVDLGYTSRLDSIEVNTSYPFLGKLNWLAGFRWVGLDDYSTTLWDGRSTGTDYAQADAWGKNELYGAQVGIEGPLWQPSSRLYLDGMIKACVFTNDMSFGRNATGTIAGFSSTERSVTRTSFLGEFGLMGRFAMTQHFVLGLGYQLTWLDGVASGVSSLGGQGVTSVLFHGLQATMDLRW